jgi:hypothetical protein
MITICPILVTGEKNKFLCVIKNHGYFYLWVLHPVAHLSNWFLMMPSIATEFQYVNSFLFFFSLTTCFAPYGPSSGEIYNWTLQWTISNATDPLHVRDPMQRCYMLHISAPTLHSQYMLSHVYNFYICFHVITCIGNAKSGRRCAACNISASGRARAMDPLH